MSPTTVNYNPSSSSGPALHSPPITVVLTVVLLIFFLLGFFSIYFCRCIMEAVCHTWNLRRSPSGGHLVPGGDSGGIPPHSGLNPALIKSLPTFLYSSVKDARKEKYGLECAICLTEFHDDSVLRLLTVCYHVFHQECVDLWLESHRTCPVCRRDLESPGIDFPAKSPDNPPNSIAGAGSPTSEVTVDIKDDLIDESNSENDTIKRRFEEYRRKFQRRGRNPRVRVCNTDERRAAVAARGGERFTRSHSTGHSIVRPRLDEEDDRDHSDVDRYTLRLPEHVRLRILRARHWTASCETYIDFERRRVDVAIVA